MSGKVSTATYFPEKGSSELNKPIYGLGTTLVLVPLAAVARDVDNLTECLVTVL
jgi:hypothetical protein